MVNKEKREKIFKVLWISFLFFPFLLFFFAKGFGRLLQWIDNMLVKFVEKHQEVLDSIADTLRYIFLEPIPADQNRLRIILKRVSLRLGDLAEKGWLKLQTKVRNSKPTYPHEILLDKILSKLDATSQKYRILYDVGFAILWAIFPFAVSAFLQLPPRTGGYIMSDPIFSLPGLISIIIFYLIGLCIWMMIRNRIKDVRREERTEKALDALAKKFGTTVDDLINNQNQEKKDNGEQSNLDKQKS